jgi:hypothetical protein
MFFSIENMGSSQMNLRLYLRRHMMGRWTTRTARWFNAYDGPLVGERALVVGRGHYILEILLSSFRKPGTGMYGFR